MTLQEILEQEIYNNKLKLIYSSRLPQKLKGMLLDDIVCINNNLIGYEKNGVLAEELGHFYTTTGDILNKNTLEDQKQENKARRWGYEKIAPLTKIIEAVEKGAPNQHEIAEYLEIDVISLFNSINHHRIKYGLKTTINGYLIVFYPYLNIYKS